MKANIDERFKPSKGGLYGSVARLSKEPSVEEPLNKNFKPNSTSNRHT